MTTAVESVRARFQRELSAYLCAHCVRPRRCHMSYDVHDQAIAEARAALIWPEGLGEMDLSLKARTVELVLGGPDDTLRFDDGSEQADGTP